MKNLTACLIVKNEAETLENVILSCPADQFVIGVDRNSTDATWEIAKKYGDPFFVFDWEDDFAKVRNLTLDRALGDWILWLDGHEFIAKASRGYFGALSSVDPQVGMIAVKLEMYEDNVLSGGRPEHFFYSNKLFRNGLGIRFTYPIHALPTGLPKGYYNLFAEELIIEHRRSKALSASRQEQRMSINAKKFLEVLMKNPKDLFAMFYLIQAYVEKGEWEKAKDWCLKYLALSEWKEERYQVRYFLAHTYLELKQYDLAYELLMDAHKDDWQRNECYLLLGDICQEQDRFPEAAHWYRLASTMPEPISPMFVWSKGCAEIPWMRLTEVYGKMGELEKARKAAKRVGQWQPKESQRIIQQIDNKLAQRQGEPCLQKQN